MSTVDTDVIECRYCGYEIEDVSLVEGVEVWAKVQPVEKPEYCSVAPYSVHRPDEPHPFRY